MNEVKTRDYLKLQNGSDIRGIALDGIPGEVVNLDVHAACMIGVAFADWLSDRQPAGSKTDAHSLKIAVGRDPRLSGEALCDAIAGGIASRNASVLDCGIASTPAMFMSTIFDDYSCDGAIMITASHLPFNRNGFKFFTPGGGLDKDDITDILERASQLDEQNSADTIICKDGDLSGESSTRETCDLMNRYAQHLRDMILSGVRSQNDDQTPLSGLKIVVDAGNGSGGFYASNVIGPLGAEVIGCFLEANGNFPNHAPNPEDKSAMASISLAVKEHGADLGIIFDTDVDRSAAVDETGKEIARNGIVALAAALVSEKHPETTVVTDSITSEQLHDFLETGLGMKHLRYKRGYRNVINKAIELNESGEECHLAIETSGHAAIKDNYFLDDGAYLATMIVIKTTQLKRQGLAISSMLKDLAEPADACEVRMKIDSDDFSAIGDAIISDLESRISSPDTGLEYFTLVEPNFEGIRANFDDGETHGWFLLRKSLHDPIMPLNIESATSGGCRKIARALSDFLSDYSHLDISSLNEYICG